MKPALYKERYYNLPVARPDGSIEYVRVNRYRLNSMNVNHAAKKAFFDKYFSRRIEIDATIFTGSGKVRITADQTRKEDAYRKRTGLDLRLSMERGDELEVSKKSAEFGTMLSYSFIGKGAPEHFQLVLQLARHWGLAPNGLQAYADSALGLDCNGFVGRYLHHVRRGNPWTSTGFGVLAGPDADISSFFPRNLDGFVRRWEDIDPSRTYIFGLVNKNNQIIGGGPGGGYGHIVITEPGDVRGPQRSGDKQSSTGLLVVESTGGRTPGLWESYYTCQDYDPKTRVFTLFREEMDKGHQVERFKIAEVR